MSSSSAISIAKNLHADIRLNLAMANRHGLIAGATGTGKTVTLQTLAEGFSARGVPVFLADVKGDLAGLSQPGADAPKILARARSLKLESFAPAAFPVTCWDIFGNSGHPVRATISEMGPVLLARLLMLNEIQAGVLNLVFRIADEHGLLLLDFKDLRAVLKHVGENPGAFTSEYGNISAASIGAIQRNLLSLESQGGAKFFGEPALNLDDLLQTDAEGRGVINILAADQLMRSPKVYATTLLWLLSELFERLPEAGDLPKPKLVFFFDEAHLLFNDIPAPLLEKVEQVVRLIRSKGVGVYFCTQSPRDIPDRVLGQLGNRVQHALRAFTPADQKLVRASAETFRVNPKLDTATVLTELEVGEALVSLLDEKGQPSVVERAWIVPPQSRVGPITSAERDEIRAQSLVAGVYENEVDRESAYERLTQAHSPTVRQHSSSGSAPASGGPSPAPAKKGFFESLFGGGGDSVQESSPLPTVAPKGGGRRGDDVGTVMAKAAMRTLTTAVVGTVSREIMRGLMGGSRRR